MKYKIYMRDWFFNAGIVGFLKVVSDGKQLNEIDGLTVGENYIEFDYSIFQGFEEKFFKFAFLKMYSKDAYKVRIEKAKTNISQKKRVDLKKKAEEIEKSPYQNFLQILGFDLVTVSDTDEMIKKLEDASVYINETTEIGVFEKLNRSPEGKMAIQQFLKSRLKGICSHENIKKYLDNIAKSDFKKKIVNKDICPSCQVYKKKYDFSNAVTNIIGFNTDNANWVWGFKSAKTEICPVCALVYTCSLIAFSYLLKRGQKTGSYLNCFYFLNLNSSLENLLDGNLKFALEIDKRKFEGDPFYAMVKQTVDQIYTKQINSIKENISFIEIVDNPILQGQGTKGYNVYSYNIDFDIADFLYPYLKQDKIPKGYYKLKDAFFNIDEVLLKLTVKREIDYATLHRYLSYWLQSRRKESNIKAFYSPSSIINYILIYINKCVRRNMMENNKIVKKAFRNGADLRRKLLSMKRGNQIDGIVYQFLNDLKISDRDKFIDKYMRLMMTHGLPSMFGEAEMIDKDAFMQFGYSFINGIMYDRQKADKTETTTEDKGE